MKPSYAHAATISQSTATGSSVGVALGPNTGTGGGFKLGQLSGTMTGATVYLLSSGSAGGTHPSYQLQILCFTDAAYTRYSQSCSFDPWVSGSYSDSQGQSSTFYNNVNFAQLSWAITTTPFHFTSGNYYKLIVTQNGVSGISTTIQTNVAHTLPRYTLVGTKAVVTHLTASAGPYIIGSNITFNTTWSGATFDAFYMYFYDDVEETHPVNIVNQFPLGDVGSYTLTYSYSTAGTYHPMVALGSSACTKLDANGTMTGSGCTTLNIPLDTSSVTLYDPSTYANNLDVQYPSTFTANPTQDIKVNQTVVTFSYNLATNFCGTLSGVRLFKGYSPQLAYLDTGAILSTSYSGTKTMIFDRTDQPYSDFYFPYIHLYCSDGSYWNVYLGGSTIQNNAQGISVYNANDIRFAMPYTWLNGGGQVSFTTGSGSAFWSDKNVYEVGEQVKLKYDINPTFTASGVDLYDNINGNLLYTFTGSNIASNQYHYTSMSYSALGTYQPYLLVRSQSYNPANPASYMKIYLGGTSTPNPEYQLLVSKSASPLYVNSGSYLGQFAGTGGVVNTAGIFGLPSSTFAGFGSTGNPFIDGAMNLVVMPVMRGMLWVASQIYNLIAATPVLSLINNIMAPPPASSYVTPQTLFNVQLPAYVAGQQFTVQYADTATWGFLTAFFQAMLGIALTTYIIRAFL